ncbi:LapA family protein [Microlunatus elymi]|uniref:LapA family protein n=1 Tax=Microlunatus elymi TaxID=2596828 RepID=A0A516PU91_9ACTN|nr:LapA family protein [Microlunatus elymi]QDP94764.1 LapA family protein [Microlunatus elymi]
MTDQPEERIASDDVASPEPTDSTQPEDSGTLVPADESVPDAVTKPAPPAVNTRTRIGAAWVAVAVGFVVLVLLLIFILQNLDPVTVHYFGAQGSMPLGVLLLFAAAGGAFLVILLGIARIIQLRWLARRDRRATAPATSK